MPADGVVVNLSAQPWNGCSVARRGVERKIGGRIGRAALARQQLAARRDPGGREQELELDELVMRVDVGGVVASVLLRRILERPAKLQAVLQRVIAVIARVDGVGGELDLRQPAARTLE